MHRPDCCQIPASQFLIECSSGEIRLHINDLRTALQGYYQKGLTNSTHKSYQAGKKILITFCSRVELSAVPTMKDTLLLFVTYLAQQFQILIQRYICV